jgi:hypothetical protein
MKCTNIQPFMRSPLVIYDFATDPIMHFVIYEENFILFFISVPAIEKEERVIQGMSTWEGSVLIVFAVKWFSLKVIRPWYHPWTSEHLHRTGHYVCIIQSRGGSAFSTVHDVEKS